MILQWRTIGARSSLGMGFATVWTFGLGGGIAPPGSSTGHIPKVNPLRALKPLSMGRL